MNVINIFVGFDLLPLENVSKVKHMYSIVVKTSISSYIDNKSIDIEVPQLTARALYNNFSEERMCGLTK